MKKLVIYCHGYKSSPNTDKVNRLRGVFPDTYAFPINVDPSKSLPYLESEVSNLLFSQEYMNVEDLELVFVGTSLGAWYANRLAKAYGVKSVLINPCYDPKKLLEKYNLDKKILSGYTSEIDFNESSTVFLSLKDEVIDYTPILGNIKGTLFTFNDTDHRFNGPEFDFVIKYLKG